MIIFERYMWRVIFGVLMFTMASGLSAAPRSGIYNDVLRLAYDAERKKLTGYYEDYTGWDEKTNSPSFSCVFYFAASDVYQSPVTIKSWFPGMKDSDLIEGRLQWSDDRENLTIRLKEEHGGCWNVQHFSDESVSFKLTEQADWVEIRVVKTSKAFFYRKPELGAKKRAYVIAGDVIMVSKHQAGWVYAEYENYDHGKLTKGWIRSNALFPIE